MRIALVPLDERPVNLALPHQVAATAGVELVTPPPEALPAFRDPAALSALDDWLRDTTADPRTTHLVVCLDTLVFGGIIPARITAGTPAEALHRLDLLREVATAAPQLEITAASLVMRASDSSSAVEEPEYWARHGRELHRLGAQLHRVLEDDAAGRHPDAVESGVPDAVRRDFELRRLRNHLVNLASIGLLEEGVIDTLAVTSDDTAPHSAGSSEQLWLRHWLRALPTGGRVLMYPGADEVGAVLVARALGTGLDAPGWRVVCGEPDGLDRVPNFENTPLRESVERQIRAAGGVPAPEHPDLVLVVHAPDPARGDCFGQAPAPDPAATERTVEAVRAALADGAGVALADVRFSNGGDRLLVKRLEEEGLLLELWSYGGWNTAGNALGGAVAQATARYAGLRRGTWDVVADRHALLTRILDDAVYQSEVRIRMHEELFGDRIGPVDIATQERAVVRIREELQRRLDRLTGPHDPWHIAELSLPWGRSFEVDLLLEPGPER